MKSNLLVDAYDGFLTHTTEKDLQEIFFDMHVAAMDVCERCSCETSPQNILCGLASYVGDYAYLQSVCTLESQYRFGIKHVDLTLVGPSSHAPDPESTFGKLKVIAAKYGFTKMPDMKEVLDFQNLYLNGGRRIQTCVQAKHRPTLNPLLAIKHYRRLTHAFLAEKQITPQDLSLNALMFSLGMVKNIIPEVIALRLASDIIVGTAYSALRSSERSRKTTKCTLPRSLLSTLRGTML